MSKLDRESLMTIKKLHGQSVPGAGIARLLGVCEGTVRYRLRRQSADAVDGRGQRPSVLGRFEATILRTVAGDSS